MPSGEVQTDEIVRHALSAGKEVFVPYLHQNSQIGGEGEEGGSAGIEAPKRVMDMVRLHGFADYESLEKDKWGIPTVTEEGVKWRERVLGNIEDGFGVGKGRRVNLDLMLMPGVVFEIDGAKGGMMRRLGHGKGFYDYFLHRYRSKDGAEGGGMSMQLFGLALKDQLLSGEQQLHVPVGPHDSLLDGLIVGDGQVIQSTPLR